MTPAERPMFDAGKPPFAAVTWSHVAITFEHSNSAHDDGVATLYRGDRRRGSVQLRNQTPTCHLGTAAVMVGPNVTGLFDELAIFDLALSAQEIEAHYKSNGSLSVAMK